jgi:hypothetical protein
LLITFIIGRIVIINGFQLTLKLPLTSLCSFDFGSLGS